MLEAVGVSELEERVYHALLDHPGIPVTDLAAAADVPPASARRALTSLEAKGLVTRSAGKNAKFLPTPPDVALDVLILRKQEELERTRLAGRELVQKLKASAQENGAGELVEVVNGRDAFARRFMQLEQTAAKEVIAFDKPPYMTPVRECNEVELERLASGVKWRGIYDRKALELPGSVDVVARMVAAGEQARVMSDVPLKLVAADGRIGLIPLNIEVGHEQAVIVHASPLLDALAALFETLWERAAPLRFAGAAIVDPDDEGAPALSDIDERVLALLAAGFTDEAAANQLGIGLSTVQRRVKRIMNMLGADSRFQAGLLLGARRAAADDG